MTLQEFFSLLAQHPLWLIAYFGALPLLAWATADLSGGKGHRDPWRYVYAVLIYLSAVPGIFAVSLSVWVFLFERRSILQTDLYTQVLPVLSMVATLLIIKRHVDLDQVPGFERLSGLVILIGALLALGWVLDKTRILLFSHMPFGYALLVFAGVLLVLRLGWKRLVG